MFVKYNLGIGTFQGSGIKDGSETYSILTVCSLCLLSLSLTRSYIAFIQNPSLWGALFIHCLFSFEWRKQNIHYNNIYVLSTYLNENVVIQCLNIKIFTLKTPLILFFMRPDPFEKYRLEIILLISYYSQCSYTLLPN